MADEPDEDDPVARGPSPGAPRSRGAAPRESAPDAGESARDGGDPAPDVGERAPHGGESAPDAGESARDGGGPAADAGEPAPNAGESAREAGEPVPREIPPRMVFVAYALAVICAVAPLAVLGAGFAGAVLFTRGRRGAGAGVIVLAVLCVALGAWLLR